MSLNTKNLNFPNRSRMIDKLYSYNNFQKTQNDSTIFKKEKSPTLIPYIPSKYKIYSLTSGDRIYRFEATPPINLATLRSRIGRHISRSDRALSLSLSLSVILRRRKRKREKEKRRKQPTGSRRRKANMDTGQSDFHSPSPFKYVTVISRRRGEGSVPTRRRRVKRGGRGSKISSLISFRCVHRLVDTFHVVVSPEREREERDLLLTRRSGDRCKSLVRHSLPLSFTSPSTMQNQKAPSGSRINILLFILYPKLIKI